VTGRPGHRAPQAALLESERTGTDGTTPMTQYPRLKLSPVVYPLPLLLSLASLALMPLASGCSAIGVAAQALPEPDVPARYANLKGHSVAALVWLPRGLETDYPALRLDLTSGILAQLKQAQAAGRGDLKGASFPHIPASLVRFQQDHPELEQSPITSVAPRLGVQRLIYVEVENFQTRSDQAVELFRGSATVSIKLVEVEGNAAKVAYQESGQTVTYPPSAPAEGVPSVGDARIYRGTVELLGGAVARKFFSHAPGK